MKQDQTPALLLSDLRFKKMYKCPEYMLCIKTLLNQLKAEVFFHQEKSK
jgi:hypothetical protein